MPDLAPWTAFDALESLHQRLVCPAHPLTMQYTRLAAALFLRRGGTVGRGMLSVLKRTRGLIKKDLLAGIDDLIRPARPSNADIVLTHDLDWEECWQHSETVLAWEREASVRSTLNLLTRGPYSLDQGRISAWEEDGFEIGLHGLWHDPALAYRSADKIESILSRAIGDLGRRPVMFRSPALSISPRLLGVVARLGIGADSSLPVFRGTYPGCGFPAPYRYPELQLVEFPLALQDDMFFRERNLSQEEALKTTLSVAKVFKQLGGTVVINTHPSIIVAQERYYRGFLEICRKLGLRCLPAGQVRPI